MARIITQRFNEVTVPIELSTSKDFLLIECGLDLKETVIHTLRDVVLATWEGEEDI